ncbi:MAG: hypothetical protein OXI44_04190 [Bacteroidota bacterium]|nr:hypothetical protein [Bacteroidota bacterium]
MSRPKLVEYRVFYRHAGDAWEELGGEKDRDPFLATISVLDRELDLSYGDYRLYKVSKSDLPNLRVERVDHPGVTELEAYLRIKETTIFFWTVYSDIDPDNGKLIDADMPYEALIKVHPKLDEESVKIFQCDKADKATHWVIDNRSDTHYYFQAIPWPPKVVPKG